MTKTKDIFIILPFIIVVSGRTTDSDCQAIVLGAIKTGDGKTKILKCVYVSRYRVALRDFLLTDIGLRIATCEERLGHLHLNSGRRPENYL